MANGNPEEAVEPEDGLALPRKVKDHLQTRAPRPARLARNEAAMTNRHLFSKAGLPALVLLALAMAPGQVRAQCSRAIVAPVGPVGMSVTVDGDKIGGAYPQLLRELGAAQACQFDFQAVPRARLELLFESGQADLMVPATRSDRRDALGEFVPLIRSRPAAVSLAGSRAPVRSLAEILARKELRVVLVRGYDFGAEYRRFAEALKEQGRLQLEVDPAALLRALNARHADLAVLNPTNLYGIPGLPNEAGMRIEALDDMPWGEAGVYLSNRSLSSADRQALRRLIEQGVRSGAVWQTLNQHYPTWVLRGAMQSLTQ